MVVHGFYRQRQLAQLLLESFQPIEGVTFWFGRTALYSFMEGLKMFLHLTRFCIPMI